MTHHRWRAHLRALGWPSSGAMKIIRAVATDLAPPVPSGLRWRWRTLPEWWVLTDAGFVLGALRPHTYDPDLWVASFRTPGGTWQRVGTGPLDTMARELVREARRR